MNFINNFYIYFLFFIEITWKINCSADFDMEELEHLSESLHPLECMRLLEAMYLRTPAYEIKDDKLGGTEMQTSQNCRVKLEEWNRNFPGKEHKRARTSMAKVLRRNLGRPDLANYIKRSKRLVELLKEFSEFQDEQQREKYLPRRHATKHSQTQLKKNKKKSNNKNLIISSVALAFLNGQLKSFPVLKVQDKDNHEIKKHEFSQGNSIKAKEIILQEDGDKSENKKNNIYPADSKIDTFHDSEDTSSTRWIAFMIFLLLIIGTILITTIIVIYKSRTKFFCGLSGIERKGCDDRCPLTDHHRKSSDIEGGLTTSSIDYTSGQWRRESSISSWCSPPADSLYCVEDRKASIKRAKDVKKKIKKREKMLKLERKQKIKDSKVRKKKKRKVSIDNTKNKTTQLSLRRRNAYATEDNQDWKNIGRPCECNYDDKKNKTNSEDNSKKRQIPKLFDLCTPRSSCLKKPKKKSNKINKKEIHEQHKTEVKSSTDSSPRNRRLSPLKSLKKLKVKEKSPRLCLEPCTLETCKNRRSPRDNGIEY